MVLVLFLASVFTCEAPKTKAITSGKATKPKPNKVNDLIDKLVTSKLLFAALLVSVVKLLTMLAMAFLLINTNVVLAKNAKKTIVSQNGDKNGLVYGCA